MNSLLKMESVSHYSNLLKHDLQFTTTQWTDYFTKTESNIASKRERIIRHGP